MTVGAAVYGGRRHMTAKKPSTRDAKKLTPAPQGPSPAKVKAAIAKAKKRALKNVKKLPLEGYDEVWTYLPEWAGFMAGADDDLASGEIAVAIGGDAMGAEETGPEQQAAYLLVTTKAKKHQEMVLDAIVAAFPKLTKGAEIELPKKVDRKALASLVSLTTAHIHWAHKDGLAYVGYELACAWDDEHGVGVMTHQDRVVDVGGADTAILGWIAERDQKKSQSGKGASKPKAKPVSKPRPKG